MNYLGVLGPRGTHSEAAAIMLNKMLVNKFELVIFNDIVEVLNAVEGGNIDAAFVPIENSLGGSINVTLDSLARSDSLIVTRELIYPVHNCLAAKCKLDNVKQIYSHSQPISQCRNFIRVNLPNVEVITTPSTSRAAEIVADSNIDDGYSAICSKRAAELNNLTVIADDIQDNMANSTRFFEVRRRTKLLEDNIQGDKVLIICQIDGKRAGALYDVLGEFAHRNINMTRIESRPARTELGAYIFFFDLETTTDRKLLNESIAAVKRKSIWLKNLGTFNVIRG